MRDLFDHYWAILTDWKLWFSFPSLLIWSVVLVSIKTLDDWWRLLYAFGFFLMLGFFASIERLRIQRRVERLSGGIERVPFMKELPNVKAKRGDDNP